MNLTSLNEFMKVVREAQRLAQIEKIKANAIVINTNYVKTPRLYTCEHNTVSVLPPMICGLEVYLTDNELPENYSFAIMDCGQTERDRIVATANYECAKEIFEKLLGYIGSQQQFCIVDEEHKTLIDCDKLFDFVGKLAQEKGVEVE